MPVVSDYTAILAITENNNYRWNGPADLGTAVFVTYSFADLGFLPPLADYQPNANDGYTVFTAAQRANFRDVVAIYEAATGVTFVEVDEGGMIDIFNTSGSAYGGWANYPYTSTSSTSDGYFVIDNAGNYDEGSYGFLTMLHELGHAMGLEHPHEGISTLAPALDDLAHTVMTYNNVGPNPSILGSFDLQALDYLYGAAQDISGWTYGFVGDVFTVAADAGVDIIMGVRGENDLSGGRGKDVIYGRTGDDVLNGQNGADLLIGLDGDDVIYGGKGHDIIYGHDADGGTYWDEDILFGGEGNDKLYTGGGVDELRGQAGNDLLRAGGGDDMLWGGSGNDILKGEGGSDTIDGGSGDDVIHGDRNGEEFWGNDILSGGSGKDKLFGRDGYDTLHGGTGADRLSGGGHNDDLFGDGGSDRLYGGAGNDSLYGGRGLDRLWGGAGADRFRFTADDFGWQDQVKDFEDGIDHIDFTALNINWGDFAFVSANDGQDTLITVVGGLEILVENVAVADFSSLDFYW